jgi:ribonuclease HI
MSTSPPPGEPQLARIQELIIWQLNVNKSNTAQTAFFHTRRVLNGTVIAFQEPYLDQNNNSRSPNGWCPVYPSTHRKKDADRSRSLIIVNPKLTSNDWEQVNCDSPDVTAIRVNTERDTVLIINAYNPCESNSSIPHIEHLLAQKRPRESCVLLGDFNRHHPQWDEPRNAHLFSTKNLDMAQPLIDLVGAHSLEMALPEHIPTLLSSATKNLTRPDNVFVSHGLFEVLTRCDTDSEILPPCTDHFPIVTRLDTELTPATEITRLNFKKASWDAFRDLLEPGLRNLPLDAISNLEELDERAEGLTNLLTGIVNVTVPPVRISPHTKRWWSKELKDHQKAVEEIWKTHRRKIWVRGSPEREEYLKQQRIYTQALKDARQQHWEVFLENLDEETMWKAAGYLEQETSDGGRARVPTLRYSDQDGEQRAASDNHSKSKVLLEAFFPPPPPALPRNPHNHRSFPDLPDITEEEIGTAIMELKPYKAPGPDGLPACVYREGVELLVPHLLPIFRASLRLGIYPTSWKCSRTVVLRKPGKPDYSAAKAYRPIALLNVISKVLSSCVAKRLTSLADEFGWLPDHHFGGRKGCNTTDALHLLVKTVKDAWARGKVASALFLDVKGAFPHAHPDRLAANMEELGVPEIYINWMRAKFDGRTTCLAFDDYVSEPLPISNGIDQGCPLSVIFYLIYNSPLVKIPHGKDELCLAYIDDVTFVAVGDTFEETHEALKDMVEREGGAMDWSRSHNSTFELDKTACVDFSRTKGIVRPTLRIQTQDITPVESHVLLGVALDQELRWKVQCNRALAKGMKWAAQLHRLARVSYGASAHTLRRLYLSIAVPRFAYAIDVWYTPVTLGTRPGERSKGSSGFAKRLQRIQTTAARAILGAMKSSPIDSLDAHAALLPTHILLNEACQRAALRLASAPESHPLTKAVARCARGRKRHIPPLQAILHFSGFKPSDFDRKPPPPRTSRAPIAPRQFPPKPQAIMDVHTDGAHVQVFSDGTARLEGVATAAVLMVNGRRKLLSGVRLGDKGDISILDAELAGILLATHLILSIPEVESATIFTDSQLAIRSLDGEVLGASASLVRAVSRAMKRVQARGRGTRAIVQWCPGHRDVPGLELADREATLTAKGKTFDPALIPPLLIDYKPPLNVNTIRDKIKEDSKDSAKLHWLTSDTGLKHTTLFPATDPHDFIYHTAKLPRARVTLLYRLITGHIPLRHHLFRIQAVDSPTCQTCHEAPETVAHFLMRCTAVADERYEALGARGRDYLHFNLFFSSSEALLPLFDFIRATGRFRDTLR